MWSVRRLCLPLAMLWAWVAHGDTIPTLTATSGRANWIVPSALISGPDFLLIVESGVPFGTYPCPTSVPAGGCVAPGPPLSIQTVPFAARGDVTLEGTRYSVYYEGNAQVQYFTPTIVYPEPTPSGSTVQIPVVLSGFERAWACLVPPTDPSADRCFDDRLGMPGSLSNIANVSIQLPGTLTLFAIEGFGPTGPTARLEARFESTPVPEPTSLALASLGIGVCLVAGDRARRKQTSQ
jgi:hypothetical protein